VAEKAKKKANAAAERQVAAEKPLGGEEVAGVARAAAKAEAVVVAAERAEAEAVVVAAERAEAGAVDVRRDGARARSEPSCRMGHASHSPIPHVRLELLYIRGDREGWVLLAHGSAMPHALNIPARVGRPLPKSAKEEAAEAQAKPTSAPSEWSTKALEPEMRAAAEAAERRAAKAAKKRAQRLRRLSSRRGLLAARGAEGPASLDPDPPAQLPQAARGAAPVTTAAGVAADAAAPAAGPPAGAARPPADPAPAAAETVTALPQSPLRPGNRLENHKKTKGPPPGQHQT
jgi:hypothetical protein